ncbi:MAG: LysR family transcriptional regulator [Alcaligenaceae bacterium]|nr:MAG: LysR family transcriptional regulator [Alcaligenaceae bacterium]
MAEPITLKQLEMLVAIADEGSFSAAAEKVGMTQSAASQCLKALETSLDVPLVARWTKNRACDRWGRSACSP